MSEIQFYAFLAGYKGVAHEFFTEEERDMYYILRRLGLTG